MKRQLMQIKAIQQQISIEEPEYNLHVEVTPRASSFKYLGTYLGSNTQFYQLQIS